MIEHTEKFLVGYFTNTIRDATCEILKDIGVDNATFIIFWNEDFAIPEITKVKFWKNKKRIAVVYNTDSRDKNSFLHESVYKLIDEYDKAFALIQKFDLVNFKFEECIASAYRNHLTESKELNDAIGYQITLPFTANLCMKDVPYAEVLYYGGHLSLRDFRYFAIPEFLIISAVILSIQKIGEKYEQLPKGCRRT